MPDHGLAIKRRASLVSDVNVAESYLAEALKSLNVFLDPGNEECDVEPAVRQAAALYLSSWVQGPLNTALDVLRAERECTRCASKHPLLQRDYTDLCPECRRKE